MTKMSDNAFPSILITEGTEPSAPAAGKQRLYIDSTTHHLTRTNSSGTETDIESGGAPAESAVTFTDITTNNASTSKHGYLKKLDNTAAHYMDGTGAWSTPSGSGVSADLLPWHIHIVPTLMTPDASTGTWANSTPGDVTTPGVPTMLANAGSNAQNDAIAWDVVLAAGTWDVHFYVRKSTNCAIITLNFDGVSQGTADTYNGSALYAKVSVTGITVSATAKIRVQAKAATRNGSNSTGWVIGLFGLDFRRTA